MNKAHSVWQISAGSTHRSYADQLIDYGVALIGPGDPGPWCTDRYDDQTVIQFATEIQVEDVLLLRSGDLIKAVGIVASGYQYLPQFDDVNGMDLQHGRRVRWCRLYDPYKIDGLSAQCSKFSKIQSTCLLDYANSAINSQLTNWKTCPLPDLPEEETSLETYPTELQELVAQVNDLIGLYNDSKSFGKSPLESEMVAHYIIPLLRALGWPVENIALEWCNIDVCLFNKLPRTPENCYYLIEAKRVGASIEDAKEQAVGYTKSLKNHCDVVVTDGIRYRMYEASKNYDQVAYANLGRLKQSSLDLFKRLKKP
ncbi:MAG: hypothetical protein OXF08_01940 [Bacteroidetes bacterium]|nr:hypothetical protein [Bacteroidota bacterium]